MTAATARFQTEVALMAKPEVAKIVAFFIEKITESTTEGYSILVVPRSIIEPPSNGFVNLERVFDVLRYRGFTVSHTPEFITISW